MGDLQSSPFFCISPLQALCFILQYLPLDIKKPTINNFILFPSLLITRSQTPYFTLMNQNQLQICKNYNNSTDMKFSLTSYFKIQMSVTKMEFKFYLVIIL